MLEITQLSHLGMFANFEVYHFEDKEIVIYDDHRCLLTVLFEAARLGITDTDTNLITFDLHDDAKGVGPETDKALEGLLRLDLANITSRDFKSFVEYDISEYDDDWVTVGMELGLINNLINIGCTENTNIKDWKNNSFISKRGRKHTAFVLEHLKDELNPHGGKLGDMAIDRNKPIRDIFGYSHDTPGQFIKSGSNFVLDFDLDCFTTTCMGIRYAWPERVFRNEYGSDSIAGYCMYELIMKSKFITICREPSYCGGIGEADKILGYLDSYFFRGCLGTRSTI